MKSKVLFTSEITPESLVKLYKALGVELKGNVLIKVHSGEPGNQNFLHAEFFKPIFDLVHGTIGECNTAYDGGRNTSEKHLKTLKDHGWSKLYPVDLLDKDGPDYCFEIEDGVIIKKDYVGKDLLKYDSLLVLSHFKGHPMGGFGGALKQLSIGCASKYGKEYIHGAGNTEGNFWNTEQDRFIGAMADSASAVAKHFKNKAIYINIMKNISVDCDCCAVAEDPCMADIGVLISEDPIAIDKACVDLIYKSNDKGRDHLLERIKSRHGEHIFDIAKNRGFGSLDYELINIDNL